ncbi:DUF2235 domain-containing protein [Nocardia higoensis]|uniref:DUF2235 domain-containing protein n=1 Tax=Nocardia higoensis TaxID=228599 RepID=A0ABS0DIR7_9NOCA|nr:DUF2235 domain-containing protein [Nocardia higoensis]MBF6358351.1 DUF2235 domain-containing protein [Nocardia higoensis]
MKRLVVCCDGTWKAENSSTVSNIVKIAQTVRMEAPGPTGTMIRQQVIYISGPGARGFTADRLIGGAFGLGLEANLSAAYWQLAVNWEPGDEIYVFGFSRGAYTARSLVGLIDLIGIMSPESMIGGHYPTALRMYRRLGGKRPNRWKSAPTPKDWSDFRRTHSRMAPVDFLGVFDTVGALGVPGVTSWRHSFHNVELSQWVLCARQALALDERRRNFEPCLWQVPVPLRVKHHRIKRRGHRERVKQVWFAGVHSDIGGGYAECGLSDATFRWMVAEARAEGLAFDDGLVECLTGQCAKVREHSMLHDSLGPGYRVLNLARTLRALRNRRSRFYWDSWRKPVVEGDHGVRLASTVTADQDYRPRNLLRWRVALGGHVPAHLVEPIPPAPGDAGADGGRGSRQITHDVRRRGTGSDAPGRLLGGRW